MGQNTRNDGKKFLDDYLGAHVGRGARRFHTMIPIGSVIDHMWDQYTPTSCVKTEESVDISLRESDYEKLLEILGFFDQGGRVDDFSKHVMEQTSYERSLRKAHPGIQKVYDKYQMLISLVANGKDIDSD